MFGVQNASAWYLRGTFNDWGTGADFGGANWCSVVLSAETTYSFEVCAESYYNEGGERFGKDETLTSDGTLSDLLWHGTPFKVTTSVAGTYYFKITDWYEGGKPKAVQVIFPEEYTARTGLTVNNFGTICLAKKAVSVTGADFYSIYGKDADTPTELYLVKETAPFEAGRPYIFQATATSIATVLEGFSTSAGSYNGLYGTFETTLSVESTNENPLYILSNNIVVKAGTGCSISNGRAYIKMNEISVKNAPTAPSAIRLDLEEDNATDINAIEASEKAVKFIKNGQLFIQKDGIVYDATGRVVK